MESRRAPGFSTIPLVLLAASFGAGILLAEAITAHISIFIAVTLFSAALCIFFLTKSKLLISVSFLLLAFACAGLVSGQIETCRGENNVLRTLLEMGHLEPDTPVLLSGVVNSAPESVPDGFSFTLDLETFDRGKGTEPVHGTVSLWAHAKDLEAATQWNALNVRYGTRVRVLTSLDRKERFRNPGGSSRRDFLDGRGWIATGGIKSPSHIAVLGSATTVPGIATIFEIRQRLIGSIHRTFNTETAGVLQAAILGNRYWLARDLAESYREGGTFHVLVISGMHISFIGLVILALISKITRNRWARFLVPTLALWCYTLAVGAESSVVRASLVFTFVSFAPIVHRRSIGLNALGAAALVLLVYNPLELFNPSFQLTFLSAFFILAVAWPLISAMSAIGQWQPTVKNPHPPRSPRWLRTLSEALFWDERTWREEVDKSVYTYRLFKSPISSVLQRWHLQRPLRFLICALIVSTSVQVGLLPLMVVYFHRVSLTSILLSIVIEPLLILVSAVGMLALCLSGVASGVAIWLARLTEQLNWVASRSNAPFEMIGLSALRPAHYSGPGATIYLVHGLFLLIIVVTLARWNPLDRGISMQRRGVAAMIGPSALVALLITSVIILSHPFSGPRPDGRLHIAFLDVGQGDSILVTAPDGTTLLIDGGGRPILRASSKSGEATPGFERDVPTVGEAVVSPYLWSQGMDRVDYLLPTHAHADHISGLCDVARNFSIGHALIARSPIHDAQYTRFAGTMEEEGIDIHRIGAGSEFQFGGVTAEVLWPQPSDDPTATSENNDSVVIKLRYGNRTFLLTGDIEAEAEERLVNTEDLSCDLVKVGHHGSDTSSTESFVSATHARYAVISVGLRSPFRHPKAEVLERWQAAGAQTLTTGERGTINVSTDGYDLKVDTFVN